MGLDDTVGESPSSTAPPQYEGAERESVLTIVKELVEDLRGGQSSSRGKDVSTLQHYRQVASKTAPRMHKSVKRMSGDLVHWMNRGGPWRTSLILISGVIASIGLTGVFVFLLFLITATVNTVIVALLGSVAAVGAVAALFFTALAGIYIGVLAVAACVLSTVAFFTILAVLTVSGWIAFWWVIWLGVKKFFEIAQGSLALTASTFQRTVSSVG